MKTIDLHVHSSASDGSCTPEEIVRLAAETGLSAVAITDHDTVEGYAGAAALGKELGVEVVPGIEISTRYTGAVHILGYFIDPRSPALQEVLDWIVQDRDARNREMAARMAADGLPVSYEQMQRRFGAVVGRPHFARVLVELGQAENIQDAFDRYVEKGRKYYIGRHFLPIERSIELICLAGGLPVLAHPFQYRLDDAQLRALIEHCLESGLRGMECRYTGYGAEQTAYLSALAKEYGLLPTGGSDFHGATKPWIRLGRGLGSLEVPYAWLEGLKEAAGHGSI